MTVDMFSVENDLERFFRYGDHKLAVFSKEVCLKIPIANARFRWRRPSAVWIQYADGREDIYKIGDPTRNVVLFIFGGAITATALFALLQVLNSKASA